MTLTPSPQDSSGPEEGRSSENRNGRSPESVKPIGDLDRMFEFPFSEIQELGPEQLLSLSLVNLQAIVQRALDSEDFQRTLVTSVTPICNDSDPVFVPFHEKLVLALADSFDTLSLLNKFAGHERAAQAVDLGEHVVEAFGLGLAHQCPHSFNSLLASTAAFIRRIDHVRLAVASSAESTQEALTAWGWIYNASLGLMHDIICLPGLKLNSSAREACVVTMQELLNQFQSESGVSARMSPAGWHICSRSLEVCRLLGDGRLHDSVHHLVAALIYGDQPFDSDALAAEFYMEDSEFLFEEDLDKVPPAGKIDDLDLAKVINEGVRDEAHRECLEQAIFALETCQAGLESLDIWHHVLKSYSMRSPEWHAALRGMAEVCSVDTAPYLAAMLNALGKPHAKPAKVRDLSEFLDRYLSVPGTPEILHQLFLNASDPEVFLKASDSRVKPERKFRLIEIFNQRLERHESRMASVERELEFISDPAERNLRRNWKVDRSQEIIKHPRALSALKQLVELLS